jgi:transcription elongation factor Elf1
MNIFKKIRKTIHNPKVSSKDGERITEWEREFIEREGKKSGLWKCPNCELDYLVEGPEGGMSQNIRCRTCGQGYNISPFGIDNIGINEDWIDEERVRALKLNKIKKKI